MWHGLEARSTLRRASWRLTNFGGRGTFLAGVAGLSRSRPVLAGAAGPRHGRNYGTALTVTTAAGTTVHGGSYGIDAYTLGSGALTINAQGNVTGKSNFNGLSISRGIFARNVGTALSVTTGAGTIVCGRYSGISALSDGTGALTITVNGNVTGTVRPGIYAQSSVGRSPSPLPPQAP